MMPPEPQPPAAAEAAEDQNRPLPLPPPVYHWYHKMSAVVFITFCLEIGFFLVIYPWTEFWAGNFFSGFLPQFRDYWNNMYLRGAVSGLGVVDVYISCVEIFRLRRFARR